MQTAFSCTCTPTYIWSHSHVSIQRLQLTYFRSVFSQCKVLAWAWFNIFPHIRFHTHNENTFSLFLSNVSRSYARLKTLLLVVSIQNEYTKTNKEASEPYTSRCVHRLLNYYISVRCSVFGWDQKAGVRAKQSRGRYGITETDIHVYISLST